MLSLEEARKLSISSLEEDEEFMEDVNLIAEQVSQAASHGSFVTLYRCDDANRRHRLANYLASLGYNTRGRGGSDTFVTINWSPESADFEF